MRPSLVRTATVGAALLALTACASSTGPTVENVAGAYEASVWTATGGVTPRDLLAEGGAIRVELTPDGAAVSSVEYPPPSTLVAGAAGVWEVRRDSVVLRLEGQPPALLGPYAVLGATLRSRGPASTFPFDPQVYEIVLTRTETP
jgi:hypothetical protein